MPNKNKMKVHRAKDVPQKKPKTPYKTTDKVIPKEDRPDREIPKKFSNYLDKKTPPEPEAVPLVELYKTGYYNAYKEMLPLVDAIRDAAKKLNKHNHILERGCLECEVIDDLLKALNKIY